jgi:molybdate transport repressor ModE-like protein
MSKPATTPPALPRLRWHWEFVPGLSEADTRRLLVLLLALLDAAALGEAAARAGMSYRSAWGLLRRCEATLGLPLVSKRRGVGTRLSPFGESLVELDGAARQALAEVHAAWEGRLRGLLAPLDAAGAPRLRLQASHDLALADWLEHGRRLPADIRWCGSEDALAALGRGECDLAGFHVPLHWSAAQLSAWLGRWLTPRLHVLVPVMERRQGLLVARGNPLRLASLADVAARGARLVNRQRGSGTRGLLDQLLAANGIAAGAIDGYAHEEFTHDAVAAAVAAGRADAALGIEAAAGRHDLDFVPLAEERYGFALRAAVAASAAGQVLLARLNGRTFRERLQALPGYRPVAEIRAGGWDGFLIGGPEELPGANKP